MTGEEIARNIDRQCQENGGRGLEPALMEMIAAAFAQVTNEREQALALVGKLREALKRISRVGGDFTGVECGRIARSALKSLTENR